MLMLLPPHYGGAAWFFKVKKSEDLLFFKNGPGRPGPLRKSIAIWDLLW